MPEGWADDDNDPGDCGGDEIKTDGDEEETNLGDVRSSGDVADSETQ